MFYTDTNGFRTYPNVPILKAGVFQYTGDEIRPLERGGTAESGVVYNVLRSPEELARAASAFRMLPFLDGHAPVGAKGIDTGEIPQLAFSGEDVVFDDPFLRASIRVLSKEMQDRIDSGIREISAGYDCVYEYAPGVYNGQEYDYIQILGEGNHLALVEEGRNGGDVALAMDHAGPVVTIVLDGGNAVDLQAILAAIADLSPEDRASLMASLTPAADEAPDEEEKKVEEDEKPDEDEEDEDEKKPAVDAASVAQDAAALVVRQLRERDAMLARVRPFVGEVPTLAQDSAATVAAYVLGKRGVKFERGAEVATLHGYLHDRKPDEAKVLVAMDAKPVLDYDSKMWGGK